MYKMVYRQQGGLSNLNPYKYMRQEVDKYLQDFNQRRRGNAAQLVEDPKPVPIPSPIIPQHPRDKIPQRIKEGFSSLIQDPVPYNPMAEMLFKTIDAPEIARLELKHGEGYTGKPSDARHQAASHEMRKSISDLLQKANLNMAPKAYTDFIGNLTTNVVGAGKEGLSYLYNTLNLWDDVSEKEARDMGVEDLKANWAGTFGIPTGEDMTPEQIYEKVYNPNKEAALQYGDIEAQAEADRLRQEQTTNNPYIGASHNSPMWFGGYPLQSGDTLTVEQMRMNRQGHTKDYRIPPNLKLQYNDDGTGTIVSKPADEMQESEPGYTTENWWKALRHYNPNYEEDRSNYFNREDSNRFIQQQEQPINTGGFGSDLMNAFQPIDTPISMQNEQQATGFQKVNNEVLKPVQEQQQGLPNLMKIVNEQRNPTPVDPNAPYGYVEYTPPFIGGGMIPTPRMVPADEFGNPIPPTKGMSKVPAGQIPMGQIVQPQVVKQLGSPNIQGFKSKQLAMSHASTNQGGLVNVYQLSDGSWDYQRTGRPQGRPLGLPVTPGGPAL